MKSKTLYEIQCLFFDSLIDEEKSNNINLHLLKKPLVTPKIRFQIYETAYRIRLSNSIREDFYRVQSQCEDIMFENILSEFIDRTPSEFKNLAEYSEKFIEFIKNNYPNLSKPAIMDWTELMSEYAAEPIDYFEIEEIKEKDIKETDQLSVNQQLSLIIHPASFVFTIEQEILLAYRSNDGIIFLNITQLELNLFSFLKIEKSQNQILEYIEESNSDENSITQTISDWLTKRIIYCKRKII